MKVFQIPVGNMQNFVYLVEDEKSKEAMAIDSGWETAPILKVARREGMRVKYVCATHGHFDHVNTVDKLASELGAATVAFIGSDVRPKVGVRDGDVLRLGEGAVRVIHTPGHTEDSVCYYDGSHLFTGDTLFIEAWGRTDLPGGSDAVLYSSLHEVIMALPGDTVVYPGHDYGSVPFRTLGEEVRKNPALRAKTLAEFRRLTQD
ncbi:MAG: MBL fold metallo-hydrolase [Thaumarchaeota archaeon]|nr:MBL fold metallo-hydrolase [Nitrososphaerota archaeon]